MERNYHAEICDQRDALLLAVEILAKESSAASLKRAVAKLKDDPYWRDARSAPAAAKELSSLLALKR